MRPTRIGLFGIGLDAYWPQFKGLKQRLEGCLRVAQKNLERPGVEIFNLGLIDNPQKALEAGHRFRAADVDLIFLHVTTYALSSTVLPVVQRPKVPVIVLNLQPAAAIDYKKLNKMGDRTAMTGEWLAHCAACPVPEIANVFNRAAIDFHQIAGMLHDDSVFWNEVDAWIDAARVADVMFHNRLGLMGHYYCGMLDIASDLTQHCATFGGHMEIIEVDELAALRREVSAKQIKLRVAEFQKVFAVQADCSPADLARAARTSVALDRLVKEHDLGSLAYYYRGTGNAENEDAINSIILGNSLLTARGIPVAGEYEAMNAQAMKIMDTFGVRGSFAEIRRDGFRRRWGAHGPRRARAHQNCRGQNESAPIKSLSRQSRARIVRGNVREARRGHVVVHRTDRGREIKTGSWPRANPFLARFWKSATRTAGTNSASAHAHL